MHPVDARILTINGGSSSVKFAVFEGLEATWHGQAEGIGVLPWSPLARGRLARAWSERDATPRAATDEFGKTLYTQAEESDRAVIERVGEVASARGVSRARVALAWMLAQPTVTSPIVGATKPEHLTDALAATSLKLSADELSKLAEPYVPHGVVGYQ